MENEPILCFQHCQKGTNITCLQMPKTCPLCNEAVDVTPMEIPPFRLPSPFADSKEKPFSVLVKPTQGSFLRDYKNSMDLHIGITDSKGYVYDYDVTGVHRNHDGWPQCVAISLVNGRDLGRDAGRDARRGRDPAFTYMWDAKLHEFTLQSDWMPDKYNAEKHNCYDFVLGFLHHMGLEDEQPHIADRQQFCTHKVLPATSQAAKYIALYRKLLDSHVSVQQPASYSTDL